MKQISFGRLVKLLVLTCSVLLVFTKTTDADLLDIETISGNYFNVIKMDIASLNSANNNQSSQLFTVSGLVPGGFQVEGMRIGNSGDEDFTYDLSPEVVADTAGLCQELELVVMRDYKKIYQGDLSGLNVVENVAVGEKDKLVFFVHFNGSEPALHNANCNFNFVFMIIDEETGQQRPGLWDVEVIQNIIASGSWAAE